MILKIFTHVTSLNDHEDYSINQHENSCKLCKKTNNSLLNFVESQWNRQPQDQHFEIKTLYINKLKPIKKQLLASEEINRRIVIK